MAARSAWACRRASSGRRVLGRPRPDRAATSTGIGCGVEGSASNRMTGSRGDGSGMSARPRRPQPSASVGRSHRGGRCAPGVGRLRQRPPLGGRRGARGIAIRASGTPAMSSQHRLLEAPLAERRGGVVHGDTPAHLVAPVAGSTGRTVPCAWPMRAPGMNAAARSGRASRRAPGRAPRAGARRYGAQAAISSGSGSRLPGGRHLTTLVMKTSLALPADGADELGQQAAGGAHERPALLVLVGTRALADEHDLGVGTPLARHGRRAPTVQRAARAGRGPRRRSSRVPCARSLGRSRRTRPRRRHGRAGAEPARARWTSSSDLGRRSWRPPSACCR